MAHNAVLLVITCALRISCVSSECNLPDNPENAPAMPQLQQQFETVFLVTFPDNSTIQVTEYYDHTNNRSAHYILCDGQQTIYLYDFHKLEALIINDGTCETKNMTEMTVEYFMSKKEGQGERISMVSDILRHVTASYVGERQVHGAQARLWTACVPLTDFKANLLFSQPAHLPASTPYVPLRFEFNTEKGEKVIYDFAFYRPGPIRDSSVFEVPFGHVCTHDHPHVMPHTLNTFTAHMEWINLEAGSVHNTFSAYDYDKKLSRHDFTALNQSDSSPYSAFKHRRLSVIHDFSTGLEYVMDERRGNCTVRPIPTESQGWVDFKRTGDDTLVMRKGFELFDLAAFNFSYQGQRHWRGIVCDVWATLRTSYPDNNTNSVIEVYFAKSTWDAGLKGTPDFLGVSVTVNTTGAESPHMQVHVYDYRPSPPLPSVFSVQLCYDDPTANIHAMFRLHGSYIENVSQKSHIVAPVVWAQIASVCEVPPLRIADVYFDATTHDSTDVWFTILKSPTVDEKHGAPTEVMAAFGNLRQAIEDGLKFSVPYDEGERELLVKQGSLMTDQEMFDPRKTPTHYTIRKTGHSNGSMAGLGIGMFFVGLVAGVVLLIMWLRRKNRMHTRVPYTRDF